MDSPSSLSVLRSLPATCGSPGAELVHNVSDVRCSAQFLSFLVVMAVGEPEYLRVRRPHTARLPLV